MPFPSSFFTCLFFFVSCVPNSNPIQRSWMCGLVTGARRNILVTPTCYYYSIVYRWKKVKKPSILSVFAALLSTHRTPLHLPTFFFSFSFLFLKKKKKKRHTGA